MITNHINENVIANHFNEKRIESMKKKTAKNTEFWLRGKYALRGKNAKFQFRMWSRRNKMFEFTAGGEDIGLCRHGAGWAFRMHDDTCVVQQYIGCKDMNGKEIFEGDILETDENGWIAVVVYSNGMFCCEDPGGGFSSYVNWSACQVIGNVYENPELVEKMRKDAKAYKELAKALKKDKKK